MKSQLHPEPELVSTLNRSLPGKLWMASRYYLMAGGVFLLASVGLIGLFGDNIRALFGAGADAGVTHGSMDRVVVVAEPRPLHGHREFVDPTPEFRGTDLQPRDVDRLGYGDPRWPTRSRTPSWELRPRFEAPPEARAVWRQDEQSVWRYEYPPGSIWQ